MKNHWKYIVTGLLNVVLTLPLLAQSGTSTDLGNRLYGANKMVAVIVIGAIILLGIAVFLISLERRIRHMERKD